MALRSDSKKKTPVLEIGNWHGKQNFAGKLGEFLPLKGLKRQKDRIIQTNWYGKNNLNEVSYWEWDKNGLANGCIYSFNISFPRKFLRELKANENVNMTAQIDIKDWLEKWYVESSVN